MRERITTCGELIGAALFSIGMGQFTPALGWCSAGLLLAAFSWLASR